MKKENKTILGKIGQWLQNEAVSISIIYAVFGALWVSLSDKLLEYFLNEFDQYAHFQTYKGWFYILVTTLLVFVLIHRRTLRLKNEIRNTATAYDKLQAAHEELVKIEAELVYQKKLTDNILEEAPVFIVTHDENEIYSFNPYSQRVCGFTEEDFKGKSWMELLVPEEYQSRVGSIFSQIRKENKHKNYEFPIRTKDGSVINVFWNSTLLSSPTVEQRSLLRSNIA